MSNVKMKIDYRTGIGSNKAKKFRQDNIIPGVIYSRGEESKVVNVNHSDFFKAFKVAGTSAVIDLELEGETLPVIIKDIQRDPVKQQIIHVDFQKLNMNETVKMSIPIVLLNRDNIKLQPSILMQQLDQVEIECLPADIPSTADVDVQDMDFTTPILVKDLDIASNDKINMLTDLETTVCTLSEPAVHAEDDEEAEETDATVAVETENNEE